MTWNPFAELYQHLKANDIRLFESITRICDYLSQIIKFLNMPVYADNAEARRMGLRTGDVFADSTGVVHRVY